MGLYSFMMDNKPTTGSIETTVTAKRKFAQESLEYNIKHCDKNMFSTLFPEYVELYETREKERKARLAEMGVEDTKDENKVVPSNKAEHDVFTLGAGFVALLSLLFAFLRFF